MRKPPSIFLLEGSHLKATSRFKIGIGVPPVTSVSQVLPRQKMAGRTKGVSFLAESAPINQSSWKTPYFCCLWPHLMSWPHISEKEFRKFRIIAGYVSAPNKIGALL